MLKRRALAALAVAGALLVPLIASTGPAQAAAPAVAATSVRCSFPEEQVKAATEATTKVAAEDKVTDFAPKVASCLEVVFTDKCDGTTVPSATNWATNDNKWTVINLKINGITKTLEGGSSPNSETWPAIGSPANESIQPVLVFDFKLENGTTVHVETPYGDPWTWEEPKGCVSPSPSASATASPSPSVSTTTTGPLYADCAAADAAGVTPLHVGDAGYRAALDGDADGIACEADDRDLPVTGANIGGPLVGGAAALAAALGLGIFLLIRRRKAEGQQ